MQAQLLGSTQPVLSLSLGPGESVIGPAAEFAWMTDSIQLAQGPPGLSSYTATDAEGTIVFAARQPGRILSVEVVPGHPYLVDGRAFLAATPEVEVEVAVVGTIQPSRGDLGLRTMSGCGRAWVGLSGDAVRHELAAGTSLRAQPWHVGLTDATVTVQLADLPDPAGCESRTRTRPIAVLSGPGLVWLQSMTPGPAALGVPDWLSREARAREGRGSTAVDRAAGRLRTAFCGG